MRGDRSRGAARRGQAHTLEGLAGALLLVGALVFALQVTAVTPLSASTSSQHIENQQQATAVGLLSTAVEDDSLRRAVLNWEDDPDSPRFYGAAERYFVDRPPENEFGALLERSFARRAIVYNVNVHYREDDRRKRQRMVYRGEPSDNAVAATVTLTLHDTDVLYDADGEPTGTELTSAGTFYAPDANPGSGVYNVVEVEVVAWRQ
jgi:hypothetical protein